MQQKFKNETVVCIASGPSLNQSQIDLIQESKLSTIAVNNNYQLVPWCDILFAADIPWWHSFYEDAVNRCKDSEFWTLYGAAEAFERKWKRKNPYPKQLNEVEFYRMNGLGHQDKVHHGGNSGYIAVNLAYLMGATKIVLVGYDHQHTYGKRHWFGDHDRKKLTRNADDVERWVRNFERLSFDLKHEKVDLVNCSIETAITSCRRGNLQEELK